MQEQNNKPRFTPTENVVAEIWMEALQIDGIVSNDNFFELGGDSLTTMMMLFRISDTLNVDLPPDTLMAAPTFKEFCLSIDSLLRQNYE